MSTALSARNQTGLQPVPDRETLETRVALNSNLWGMPDDQVWLYYRWMAERLGLDPMSHPFDVITDQKQQTKKLYANSSCTSQLGEKHRISYGEMKIDANEALIKLGYKVAHVSVRATAPNGRFLVAEAFVDLIGYEGRPLAGNNLVNALKKAGTQCRRRATLQLLGLAVPSEEIPTIKLGDIEKLEGECDGVIIEHPPAAALSAPAPAPVDEPADAANEAFINQQLLAYCKTQKGDKNAQAFFDAKFASLSLDQRQAEAAKLGLLNPSEAAPVSPGTTRRDLVNELIGELQSNKVEPAKIGQRMAGLCGGKTDVGLLTDGEVEEVIEDFSVWLDSFIQ